MELIVSVRGAVVDVAFDRGPLPPINSALIVEWDRPESLILEVCSHLDRKTVRSVAMQATAGLARGVAVRATGAAIEVPVGEAVLGRLLDALGASTRSRTLRFLRIRRGAASTILRPD